jgi:hypothetical protein
MLNRTAVTKGREEAEDDITFIVKNKSMPSVRIHTSTRITYYPRRYKDSVEMVRTKRHDGSGTGHGGRSTSRSTNDDENYGDWNTDVARGKYYIAHEILQHDILLANQGNTVPTPSRDRKEWSGVLNRTMNDTNHTIAEGL